jgi:D-alanyl-D-alanine carboxypeptidase
MNTRTALRVAGPLTFAALVLAAVGWGIHLARLTRRNDRACIQPAARRSSEPGEMAWRLQRALDDASARYGGIGLQATVIFRQGTPWTGASGYASLERRCPITPDHGLAIGSMTKLFTAALVLQQVEEGAIGLDDPVSRWVDLPAARSVTVRQLLNHTAGLPEYAWNPWLIVRWLGLPARTWRPDQLLAVIQDRPLHFSPGARHEYSNSNYLLLGIILERAAGHPYGALLRERLLVPEGLANTHFLAYPTDLAIANGYDEALLHLGRRNVTGFRRSLLSGGYAGGGILSTSEDVARFLHALLGGQVLPPDALRQMQAWAPAPDSHLPEQQGYGLGLRKLVLGGDTWVGHTGSIPGYSGIAVHQPERGMTIVALSNLSRIRQIRLLEELRDAISESARPQGGTSCN